MNTIKLGIIGTNFVSDWMCEAVSKVNAIEISAVYSRTIEKGSEFAKKNGIENVYTDIEKFFCSGINAVYIASPNCAHAKQAIDAANHGLHILCEKPIASDSAELAKMLQAAEENKVVLLEAMRPAYDKALFAIKDALCEIAPVRNARFEFCQYSSRYDKYKNGTILRAFDPSFSNAAIMDIGVYALHTCLRLFGKPEKEILSSSVLLPNGMEGSGCAILPYNGMTAQIVYSKIIQSTSNSTITGENGAIFIDSISTPSVITLQLRGKEPHTIYKSDVDNNMVYEVCEFVKLISSNNIHHENTEYSVWEMEIIDKIREQNDIVF